MKVKQIESVDTKFHFERLECGHIGSGNLRRDALRAPGEDRRCFLCDKKEKT